MLRRYTFGWLNPTYRRWLTWAIVGIGIIFACLLLITWLTGIDWSVWSDANNYEVQEFTEHRLVRIPAAGEVGGVLAGFAYYFAIPVWLVRVAFVAGLFILKDDASEFLVVGYFLLWFFMPEIGFLPADYALRTG